MTSESNVVSLVPWSMSVRRAAQRRKAFELLEHEDADERIRKMGALETYYAIKEIGLEDAIPILSRLQREQRVALFDIESWHRGQFDPQDFLLWMSAFREAGIDALTTAAASIDREVLALVLRRRLFVAHKPRDNETDPDPIPDWLVEPDDDILPLVETPDRRFIIAARNYDEVDEVEIDEEDRKWALQFVDELYKQEDHETILTAMRLAIEDLSSTLEEDSLRFRNARMEDLGFPSLERALEVYGPLGPERLDAPAPPSYPRAEIAVPVRYAKALDDGLFSAALHTIHDVKTIGRIESELAPLANRALVADGAEPGQLDEVTATLMRMKGYIEIALAAGVEASERVSVAADRLARVPLTELFRIGYTVTLRLAARARTLVSTHGTTLLDDDDRALFDALHRRRPQLCHLGLDRAFGGADDVDWVDGRIKRLELLLEAADTLKILHVAVQGAVLPPLAERTLDVLIATAACRVLTGGLFEVTPFSGEALSDVADHLALGDGAFSEADILRALAPLESVRSELRVVMTEAVTAALARVSEALWPLVGVDHIDPRYVDVVLVRVA